MDNSLLYRDTSGFPLSIGTSLALESVYEPIQAVIDPDREVPKKIDLSIYDCVIYNIDTLLRNMISSINTEAVFRIKHEDFLETLLDEIYFLKNIYEQQNKTRVEFYINNYEYYHKKYHPKKDEKSIIKEPSGDKQINIEKIHEFCRKNLLKDRDVDIHEFDRYVKIPGVKNALIITHVPVDLLSYCKYTTLHLLESHTGVLKTVMEFNTKYNKVPREDMSFLPFKEQFLIVFGDKVTFKPKPISVRLELYSKAKKAMINPLTSDLSLEMKGLIKK